MSFEEKCFTTNPNFRFEHTVTETADCLSSTYQFDCYKDKKGEVILIAPFFDLPNVLNLDHHISLINLKDNKEIKKLEGHIDRVVTVRYFRNPITGNDYFISADRKYNIIVWDLSNDCAKILETEVKYEGFIYSCLLIFDEKKMYAVTSSLGANNYTRVIDCDDKNKIIDITESKDVNVYYLGYWQNPKAADDEKHVIIQCAKNKILMSTFPSNKTYHVLQTDDKHPYNLAGIVFKNKGKDMFAASATYGLVQIIDLEEKQVVKSIELEDVHLYSFVKWNERYLLLNDCLQRRIIVFDMEDDYKIKSKVLCPEMHFDRFIKKVEHPIYGEAILSVGIDWKIKLFINRNITKKKEN